ncbi:CRISPR-associated helicase/endonuclease Cas3 [Malaciobacter halophilus]|nr:CRISPR-associated helicase Cas3' [Malaciobacter halophilus]RYA24759.1 CRISPR-associated helicase/endonuclease Cas3 [Malaciobacter halophilus]
MYVDLDEQKYENYFAHTCGNKPKEKLIDHCNLTKFYLEKIIKEKNLSNLIDNMIVDLDKDNFILIKKLFYNAIFLHDLGKTNNSFQANKMDNELFEKTTISSEHSIYSSKEFIKLFTEEVDIIEDDKIFEKINYILNTFSYAITKHHGKLDSIEDYNIYEDGSYELVKKKSEKYINNPFEFYILNKLLFSLLVSSDYYATTQYMADLPTTNFGTIKDKQKIINKFEEYKIIRNIRSGENIKGINKLRSKMFLEAEENLQENNHKNIFYLEAPTGSGKTLTSINLAMNLIKQEDINKIFYVFPFNTLVEQTKKQLDDIFDKDLNIEVINSITPIKEITDEKQEDEESKYQKSYMSRLFFHNELILTTHIAFFNILFGITKEDNFPLWQMANSVIILDEIQSYDNKLWSYMIKFFSIYAKVLNMKIIIMSATLPKLDNLIDSEENKDIFVELIKNKNDYFQSEYFKNRVEVDFSLLEQYKEIKYDILIDKLDIEKENYSKIVFEFIKKDSAREFFEKIEEDIRFSNFEIFELSGDDNKATREHIIQKIKDKKELKIILVATQVIEAGVDIDMDLGFKDISTIDSEEQFLGRINRSCLKLENKYKPKVYFFNKDEESRIYKEDNRIEDNLRKDEFRQVLLDKNFENFYKNVFRRIKSNDSKIKDGILGNFEKFNEKVQKLNYKEIQEKMRLINTQSFRLYFPFKLDISKYKIDEFKDKKIIAKYVDEDENLDGLLIWEEFEKLNDIKNYAQKEVKRSELNSLMQFFTFNITKYSDKQSLPYFDYICGSYHFISNYDDFIKNGKFNRKAYQDKSKDIFW